MKTSPSGKVSSVLVLSLGLLLVVLAQVLASCQKEPAANNAQAASATPAAAAAEPVAAPIPPEPPAPTSAPADGLIAQYDAAHVVKEGNAVKEWTDLSGHKNTVGLPTADPKCRPVQIAGEAAGLPVVRFDGDKKQYLFLDKLKSPTAEGFTVVVVARTPKTPKDYTYATLGTYADNAGNPDYLTMNIQGISGRLVTANIRAGLISSPGPLTGGDFKLAMAEWDLVKGTSRIFQNGQLMKAGPGPKKVNLGQNVTIGSYCGVINYLDGDVAEILFYNRALSDSQRRDVNAYLVKKYKLDFAKRITPLASTLPFAYYPSRNQIEAAVDVRAFGAKFNPAGTKEVTVTVVPVGADKPVAKGKIALNAGGFGQDTFDIPDLKDGKYNVHFTYNGVTKVSPKVIERIHFPWEKCDLGTEHKIYAPFEPVTVKDDQVSVVSRTLRTNGFGLFDSIVSEGQELLAEPIRLEGTAGGKKITWTFSKPTVKSQDVDLATVEARADGGAVTVKTHTRIEEDGCARVELDLSAGTKSATIDSLWVEIPLKDEQVPLFHYAVASELRNNYGGVLPRGGKVVWDMKTQIGSPPTYHVEQGPSDGVVWDSTQWRVWPSQVDLVAIQSTFMPYIWLGGESRGLAWFGDSSHGYEIDSVSPIQTVTRDGNKVVLRINLVQTPLTLRTPRKIVFGLQPSPTKPLPADWRSRDIPAGWECVTPWGGYYCSSKYPDNHDFTIVDSIAKSTLTGKVDEKFLEEKDKNRVRKNDKVQGNEPWINTQKRLASIAGSSMGCIGRPGSPVTYFEEHATEPTYPEFQVFTDEWSELEFSRFQPYVTAGGGNFTASYRNFVAYYGNEYIRRGVGLYFDNCYPQVIFNPASADAFSLADGVIRPTSNIWDSRAYFKRIWKIVQDRNEKKTFPYPVNFYVHMTNAQVLPYTTWTTFLLDQEQVYRRDAKNQLLPWPADYLRAVTIARTVGSIPTALNPLRNGLRDSEPWPKASPELRLTNWGMHTVHEVGGMGLYVGGPLDASYGWTWNSFGYRTPDVTVYNYWDPKAPIKVDNDKVKWIAQTRGGSTGSPLSGRGMIVLQSYTPAATEAAIRWPGAVAMMEFQTRKQFTPDKDGLFHVKLAADYGTAMLTVFTDAATVPPAADAKALFAEDFEFGLQQNVKPLPPGLSIVPDSQSKGNFVLRIMPAKTPQFFTPAEGKAPAGGSSELSFRIRVPNLPKDRRVDALVAILYGSDPKGINFQSVLGIDTREDGATWIVTLPYAQDGKSLIPVAAQADLTSALSGQGPVRKELGKPDTAWHRVVIRVDGKVHTVLLDDKVVCQVTAPTPAGAGFGIGSNWDQTASKSPIPYVEIDDVKVTPIVAKP